jgi:hypothetical protein
MQPTWKHYADYFAMGLLLKICSTSEIVTWVDRLIEDTDYPTEWMIELSTGEGKHILDIIHILDIVPGSQKLEISLQLLIAKLSKVYPTISLKEGQSPLTKHRNFFGTLYSFVLEQDHLPDAIRGPISQLYIDLDYIEQESGDWQIIEEDYLKLLDVGNNCEKWIDF